MLKSGIIEVSFERGKGTDMSAEFMENLIIEQQQTIKLLTATIDANSEKHSQEIQKLNQTIANLQEQIVLLSAKIFGSTTEKTSKAIAGQMNLFDLYHIVNEVETLADETLVEPVLEEITTTKHRKKKTTKAEQFKHLPIIEIEVDFTDDKDKFCDYCNAPLEFLGKELVREELRITPAKLERIQYIRKNYICVACKQDDTPFIKKPIAPTPLIPHSFASASLVSYIMYQKYVNAMPLYRQEKDINTFGVAITRATLANWVNTCSTSYLVKIFDQMHEELLKREVLMSDETPCQVLKEEGKKPTSKSYMWVHRTGNDGLAPIILYDYQSSRKGEHAVNFLKGFQGYHHCDGFSGYTKLKDVTRCACLAHIRRKFFEAIPKQKQAPGVHAVAEYGVAYCNKLFKLEESFKELTPDERKQKRLEEEKPILDAFLCWINQQDPPRGSKLYQAITYAKNQWAYMNNYLLDGRCSISNNWTENSVRPYTLIRKNSLFHDTPKGATASAIICSIIETAKANNLNIQKYLEHLLLIMPDYEESAGMEELMPWSDTIQDKFKNLK